MKISKEVAQELLELDVGEDTLSWVEEDETFPVKFKLIFSNLVDTSRWSKIYEVVYEDLVSNRLYRSTYCCGATECQDESPYEHDDDEIEFDEVFAKTKVTTYYSINK